MSRRRLGVITTTPLIVNFFLRGHLAAWARAFDVTLIVNCSDPVPLLPLPETVRVVSVEIERPIRPWRDLRALVALARRFRAARFSAIISFAPKAGLLAMIAGAVTRVPFRCHVFQGEVWANKRGLARTLLATADRICARLATDLLVISRSELAFLEAEGVVKPGCAQVLGPGSVCGVDTARFRPDRAARERVRAELQIPADAIVVLFLGRLIRDKGVLTLAEAFIAIAERHPRAVLLFVGPDEEQMRPRIEAIVRTHVAQVRFVGLTHHPEQFCACADVLALPSVREGFGAVILEAAAAGVPAVASRIYGITDALVDGETGLLHAPGNAVDLARVLERMIADEHLRTALAARARKRAFEEFEASAIVQHYADHLDRNVRD